MVIEVDDDQRHRENVTRHISSNIIKMISFFDHLDCCTNKPSRNGNLGSERVGNKNIGNKQAGNKYLGKKKVGQNMEI